MSRIITLFTCLILFNFVLGQTVKDTSRQIARSKIIKGDSIKIFIDSIKIAVLNDTIKFNSKDLSHINGRTQNSNSYSVLFNIDHKYFYKLDIISGTMVAEFANEILDASKIKEIYVLDKKVSQMLYGEISNNGCINISTKRNVKLRFKIAGLKYNKKRKTGNNFLQIPKGEPYIMIRT